MATQQDAVLVVANHVSALDADQMNTAWLLIVSVPAIDRLDAIVDVVCDQELIRRSAVSFHRRAPSVPLAAATPPDSYRAARRPVKHRAFGVACGDP